MTCPVHELTDWVVGQGLGPEERDWLLAWADRFAADRTEFYRQRLIEIQTTAALALRTKGGPHAG